jgi:hypothetical protein
MTSRGDSWAHLVSELLEDLAGVMASHLRLARQEAGEQGRVVIRAAALILAGALALQSALLLAAAGLGLAVGRWLDEPILGILAAAATLLGAGLVLLLRGRGRLRRLRPLAETCEELGESRRWLEREIFPRLRRNADD